MKLIDSIVESSVIAGILVLAVAGTAGFCGGLVQSPVACGVSGVCLLRRWLDRSIRAYEVSGWPVPQSEWDWLLLFDLAAGLEDLGFPFCLGSLVFIFVRWSSDISRKMYVP
jgi:hypothetical protein